jgi:hypothetical protein
VLSIADYARDRSARSAPLSLLSTLSTTLSTLRKRPASGDAAARIFLPQLVDFDLNFLSQFLSDFFNFRFKKKARIFLFDIHHLPTRDMAGTWSGCAAKSAVAVSR